MITTITHQVNGDPLVSITSSGNLWLHFGPDAASLITRTQAQDLINDLEAAIAKIELIASLDIP
jgi:hypothetical protein